MKNRRHESAEGAHESTEDTGRGADGRFKTGHRGDGSVFGRADQELARKLLADHLAREQAFESRDQVQWKKGRGLPRSWAEVNARNRVGKTSVGLCAGREVEVVFERAWRRMAQPWGFLFALDGEKLGATGVDGEVPFISTSLKRAREAFEIALWVRMMG